MSFRYSVVRSPSSSIRIRLNLHTLRYFFSEALSCKNGWLYIWQPCQGILIYHINHSISHSFCDRTNVQSYTIACCKLNIVSDLKKVRVTGVGCPCRNGRCTTVRFQPTINLALVLTRNAIFDDYYITHVQTVAGGTYNTWWLPHRGGVLGQGLMHGLRGSNHFHIKESLFNPVTPDWTF